MAVCPDLFFAVKITEGARRSGHEVKFARSLGQAADLVRSTGVVLLVADLQCKEIDTLALARQLRSEPALASVALLGFVPHVQEDLRQAALSAGFDKVVARSTFSDKAAGLLSETRRRETA